MILQLQKTVGNRAVSQLFRTMRSEKTVQRKLEEYVPGGNTNIAAHQSLSDDQKKELDQLIENSRTVAKSIDTFVEDGREEVQAIIDLVMDGTISALEVADQFTFSGHAQDFQNKMLDFVSGNYNMHPSVSGGYVIEDYASSKAGNDVSKQKTPKNLRGSRPDFMIPMAENGPGGREYYGLLDVTSRASIGHILFKGDGTWTRHVHYPYVAESVYEPLNFGQQRQMTDDEQKAYLERAKRKAEDKEALKGMKKTQLELEFDKVVQSVKDDFKNKGVLFNKLVNAKRPPRIAYSLSVLGISYTSDGVEAIGFESWYTDKSVSLADKKEALNKVKIECNGRFSPY